MKIAIQFLFGAIVVLSVNQAGAEILRKAYLDQKNHVHVLTSRGKHQQISYKDNASMLKLAPDNQTVAWLVLNTWVAEGDDRAGAEELVVYRNGKAGSIKCAPFIRDYWFWKDGRQIVIDCGGRRFAGHEILFDTRTLKKLDILDQATVPADKRPDWSHGDD